VPSELGEDDVMAAIIPKADAQLTAEDLALICKARMASFMVPRYIEFRTNLPKTGKHRVQKSALKAQCAGPATWDREKHP
jgi:crotonobetaine/carnitine-CoA ligase